MNYVISFSTSDESVKRKYASLSIPIAVKNTAFNNRKYRYFEIGDQSDSSDNVLLFVHGAPGAGEMFEHFLTDQSLRELAILISIDRFGYGKSDQNSEPTLKNQAAQLHHLLKQYKDKNVIAIGHSYGGPIITQLAIDYPNDVNGLLLLAPAQDPELERFEQLAKLASWRATKWYFPNLFQVASDEKAVHRNELKKMEPFIKDINVPVTHMHGTKDWIVPYNNVLHSQKHYKSQVLKIKSIEGAGHLLFEKEYLQTVKAEILDLLSQNYALNSTGED